MTDKLALSGIELTDDALLEAASYLSMVSGCSISVEEYADSVGVLLQAASGASTRSYVRWSDLRSSAKPRKVKEKPGK